MGEGISTDNLKQSIRSMDRLIQRLEGLQRALMICISMDSLEQSSEKKVSKDE